MQVTINVPDNLPLASVETFVQRFEKLGFGKSNTDVFGLTIKNNLKTFVD